MQEQNQDMDQSQTQFAPGTTRSRTWRPPTSTTNGRQPPPPIEPLRPNTGSRRSHQQPPPQPAPQEQEAPPPGGRATNMGNGAVKWEFGGQTVYVRDATKHPPGASYTIALLVGLACIFAVFWQMFTTFSAFSSMVFDGKLYQSFPPGARDVVSNTVVIVCVLIAVSFQAPLLFFAFKIDKHFATTRHLRLSMSAKIAMIWEGTKAVVASNLLLSIWAVIALVADTIGDVTFVAKLTDSSFFLFFYATGLYGLSTLGLSECLQILWDGMVTSEWLKHVQAANEFAAMEVAKMKHHGGSAK